MYAYYWYKWDTLFCVLQLVAEGETFIFEGFLVVGRLSVPKNGNPSLVSLKKRYYTRDWDIFFAGNGKGLKSQIKDKGLASFFTAFTPAIEISALLI